MESDPPFDRNRSLLQLCGDALEDEFDALPLALLNRPVRKLRAPELHHLLQRNIAVPIAAPLAVDLLQKDPFAEADGQPGGLLVALMESSTRFWLENFDLWLDTCGVLQEALTAIATRAETEERGDYMPFYVGDDFMSAVVHFRSIHDTESEPET